MFVWSFYKILEYLFLKLSLFEFLFSSSETFLQFLQFFFISVFGLPQAPHQIMD